MGTAQFVPSLPDAAVCPKDQGREFMSLIELVVFGWLKELVTLQNWSLDFHEQRDSYSFRT